VGYEEGYTKLLTYKQGLEIYQKTKRFTARYLERFRDSRLIGHMNDEARSVPSNICEGAKRGNTKAYLEFLGFTRGSLEELKRDYEELKRELRDGERWTDKDRKGKRRIEKEIEKELRELPDLVYGEDCMLGRQIRGLEAKAIRDKELPQGRMIKRVWKSARDADRRFWAKAKERFGIEKDEKGIRRKKKDTDEDKDKGRDGEG